MYWQSMAQCRAAARAAAAIMIPCLLAARMLVTRAHGPNEFHDDHDTTQRTQPARHPHHCHRRYV